MADEHHEYREESAPWDMHGVERHFQSMILVLMTAVIGWMGWTVQDLNVKTATITEKLVQIEARASFEREQLYTAKDAAKDQQLQDNILANLASRVLALEQDARKPR